MRIIVETIDIVVSIMKIVNICYILQKVFFRLGRIRTNWICYYYNMQFTISTIKLLILAKL